MRREEVPEFKVSFSENVLTVKDALAINALLVSPFPSIFHILNHRPGVLTSVEPSQRMSYDFGQ